MLLCASPGLTNQNNRLCIPQFAHCISVFALFIIKDEAKKNENMKINVSRLITERNVIVYTFQPIL